MKVRNSYTYLFFSLFVLLICLFGYFLNVKSIKVIADEVDTSSKYTYTKEVIKHSDEWESTDTYYYIDDIEGGFGELVKTLNIPSSYNISAVVKSDTILDVVNEISIENDLSMEYKSFFLTATIFIDGFEQEISRKNYSYSEYEAGIDFNKDMQYKTVTANDEYDIQGNVCFTVASPFDMTYFVFNLRPIHMSMPVEGSILSLESLYFYAYTDTILNETIAYSVKPVGTVFSSDENDSCYIVSSVNEDGLPSSNYTMSFIYGGKASIEGSDYSVSYVKVRDEAYTVQGKLDFITTDGESHTLYTNVITVQHHNVKMKIDGLENDSVGVGVEHEYSFTIDDNNLKDIEHLSASLEMTLDGKTDYIYENQGLKYNITFDEVGLYTIRLNFTFSFNEGREFARIQGLCLNVNVLENEPIIIPPEYNIVFDVSEDSAVF